jgi:uncharacterized membrane protein YGL010W
MIQGVIDAIDAQINKSRSPAVSVALGTPFYIIVALPLGFIVGVVANIVLGTAPNVAQESTPIPIIAGLATIAVFWLFASYGTYTSAKKLQNGDTTGE